LRRRRSERAALVGTWCPAWVNPPQRLRSGAHDFFTTTGAALERHTATLAVPELPSLTSSSKTKEKKAQEMGNKEPCLQQRQQNKELQSHFNLLSTPNYPTLALPAVSNHRSKDAFCRFPTQ